MMRFKSWIAIAIVCVLVISVGFRLKISSTLRYNQPRSYLAETLTRHPSTQPSNPQSQVTVLVPRTTVAPSVPLTASVLTPAQTQVELLDHFFSSFDVNSARELALRELCSTSHGDATNLAVVAYHSLLDPVEAPTLPVKTTGANNTKGRHCQAMPSLRNLPKVEYRHKKPKKSELSAHQLLELLMHGHLGTGLPADWFSTHRVEVYLAPQHLQSCRSPHQVHVQYPPPIRFRESLAFNVSQPFGLWETYFVDESDRLKLERSAKYPQRTVPQPALYYAVFHNAWVSDGNVITCTKAFTTGACMWEFKEFPVVNAEKPEVAIVAFCDHWCNGYFHFTHEHLPRVALVHHLLMSNSSVKITAPRRSPFVMQYLVDVLGIPDEQIIARTGDAYFALEVIYPQPQRCGSIFSETLFLLRRIVFERLGLTKDASGVQSEHVAFSNRTQHLDWEESTVPIVILAERKKLDRMPKNYKEVIQSVKDRFAGTVLFVSTIGMSVVQQIRLFHKAMMVIGPHGANLANVMWMRHGAYVLEFISYKYANMCYYGTSARLGLHFGAIFHGAGKAGAYNTTAEEIADHIQNALSIHQ